MDSPTTVHLSEQLLHELRRRSQAMGMTVDALADQILSRVLDERREPRSLFVSAPVKALVEGIYQEDTTIAEMLTHGDFGLGTFNDLDGEMVVLDGQVYQLKSDGLAHQVEGDVRTPFACVSFFNSDSQEEVAGIPSFSELTALLERMIPSPNMIYAIRIDGAFDYVRTRSVARQENYRPLVEVTRQQTELEHHQVQGSLAGYWTPSFMESLAVPGYHLHFISADRRHGGHLLECRLGQVRIAIQHLPKLEVGLPVTLDYLTAQFTRDVGRDLDEAER